MESGTFHVMAQSWRYFSKEKAMTHTLHVGQLSSGTAGDTILIGSTSPAAQNGGGGYSVPPMNLPPGNGGGNITVTFSKNQMSTCYGSVYGNPRTILAQKNMDIQYGVWNSDLKEIIFTPHESGWFRVHIEFTTGLRGYETPEPTQGGSTVHHFLGRAQTRDGFFTSDDIFSVEASLSMDGFLVWPTDPGAWRPTFYLSSILSAGDSGMHLGAPGWPFHMRLINMCHPNNPEPNSYMSAYVFKYAEL